MKVVIEIIIEIDQDSFSFYILIRCCPMIPSSSGLPDDVAFLMAIILHNFVPIMEMNEWMNEFIYTQFKLTKMLILKNKL